MLKIKQRMAKSIVDVLEDEIRRYQDMHSEEYIKALQNEQPVSTNGYVFDETMTKLNALYELKGELRAKGFI